MKTSAQNRLTRVFPLTLLLSAAATAQPAPTSSVTTLATPDQRAVETQAIKVFASPVVQQQITASKRLFLASPVAASDRYAAVTGGHARLAEAK